MAGLLEEALAAHGGEERWRSAREVRAHVTAGGFLLRWKGASKRLRAYDLEVDLGNARSVFDPYPEPGKRGVFDGNEVWIESDGEVLDRRRDPRSRFGALSRRQLWWDPLDSLYFAGYAMWNYLNSPLLLTRPDIELREGEPWEERPGERWRRLDATFPPTIPTHSREQVFYFDERGLLRRHDYTAEVNGSFARAVHYSDDHREFDGLVFPTRRLVVPRTPRNRSLPRPKIVWMEIDRYEVSRA